MEGKPEYLYQYRKINEHTLSALINNKIWLAHPSTVNDPFDSVFYYKDIKVSELQKVNLKGNQEKVTNFNNKTKRYLAVNFNNFFISSFSEHSNCILMWSHYADSHKGFCVKYKVRKYIKEHEDKTINLSLHKVTYPPVLNSEYDPLSNFKQSSKGVDESKQNTLAILGFLSSKAKCWIYESEYRLIYFPLLEKFRQDLKTARKKRKTPPPSRGKLIEFPSDMLEIEAIIFGCKCSDQSINTIKQIFKDKGQAIDFYKCKADHFTLTPEKLSGS